MRTPAGLATACARPGTELEGQEDAHRLHGRPDGWQQQGRREPSAGLREALCVHAGDMQFLTRAGFWCIRRRVPGPGPRDGVRSPNHAREGPREGSFQPPGNQLYLPKAKTLSEGHGAGERGGGTGSRPLDMLPGVPDPLCQRPHSGHLPRVPCGLGAAAALQSSLRRTETMHVAVCQ